MDLKTFISDLPRRRELARRLGRSPDYLYQLGVGFQGKRASAQLATAIERESADMGKAAGKRGWKVTRESLRPDIFGK